MTPAATPATMRATRPAPRATPVTLVPHLIRKDLRAVAIVALIWTVLMAIELTLQLTGLSAPPRLLQRTTPLQMLRTLLPFAEVMIAALLVSFVIHEDPLTDTRAFWLTRPVPRGQLFTAKLATIAIVIFAPALAALAILLAWYRVPPFYMMRAGLEVVLWLGFPLLILIAAAALTSTLSRYFLLLFGMIVTALAIFGLSATAAPASANLVFEARLPRFDDPAPRVTVVLLLITGFCVALHQFYRRRDPRVALGGIAVVCTLAFAVARYFPDFTFFKQPGTAQGAWAGGVRLRLLDDAKMVSAYHPRELRSVAAPLVLEGLPAGYSATPFTLNGQLTRADGTVLRSGRAAPVQVAAKGGYQPSLTLSYRDDPLDAGPTKWEMWPVLLELPAGHRGAVSPAPAAAATAGSAETAGAAPDAGLPYYSGSYEGVFMYRIARHEHVAALRLDRREHITDGPRGIRIVASQDYKSSCLVSAEMTTTELTLAGPYEPAAGFYFIDRRTRRALRAERLRTTAGVPGPLRVGLPPGHRIFTTARVQWSVENPRDGSPGDISPCSDTDLSFVRTIAAGSITRSIKLPEFRAQPAQDTFFRR